MNQVCSNLQLLLRVANGQFWLHQSGFRLICRKNTKLTLHKPTLKISCTERKLQPQVRFINYNFKLFIKEHKRLYETIFEKTAYYKYFMEMFPLGLRVYLQNIIQWKM